MLDYVAFKEVFGILKAGLNIVKVYSKIKYWCCFFFSKPYPVLIYGASGVGKSEFCRSLFEKPIAQPMLLELYCHRDWMFIQTLLFF